MVWELNWRRVGDGVEKDITDIVCCSWGITCYLNSVNMPLNAASRHAYGQW